VRARARARTSERVRVLQERLSGAARRKMTAGIYGAVKAASRRASLFYDFCVNTSTSARVSRCFITSWRCRCLRNPPGHRAHAARSMKRIRLTPFRRSRVPSWLLLIGQVARDYCSRSFPSRDFYETRTRGAFNQATKFQEARSMIERVCLQCSLADVRFGNNLPRL